MSKEIDKPLVKEQLNRILESTPFKTSAILSRFLAFVVKETLAHHENQIKEYTIAREVLNRDKEFNPQLDAIVRIHALRLRNSLNDYYQNGGTKDKVLISIPKGRYVANFAWNTFNNLDDKVDKKIATEETVRTKPAVAVMPLKMVQKNERLEVICAVFRQELSIELTRFQEIDVLSNHASEVVGADQSKLASFNDNLQADYSISGSCFLEKEKLRINIELVSLKDGHIIWGEHYDIDNIENDDFSFLKTVLTKISAMTCGYFGVVYRDALHSSFPNSFDDMYAVFVHNRYHQEFTMQAYLEADSAIEKGLLKEPKNALLLALKAELVLNLTLFDLPNQKKHLRLGTKLVERAIHIDQNCQHAYQVLAWSNILHHNVEAFNLTVQSWLKINPNIAQYIGQAGFCHVCIGSYEKGLELMLQSISLNPYYPWNLNVSLCFYYINLKDFAEANYWSELIDRPGLVWDPLLRISTRGLSGKTVPQKTIDRLFEIVPDFNQWCDQILDRFIIDKKLQKTIKSGLVSAGVLN